MGARSRSRSYVKSSWAGVRSSGAGGGGARAARGERQEQRKGAQTAKEKLEQRESGDRSNGRGRARGLLWTRKRRSG